MKAWWKLLLVVLAVTACTAYTAVVVRFKPKVKRERFRAERQRIGARIVCRLLDYRVTLRDPIPEGQPMLYVCNHLTALDPIFIASQIPASFAGKVQIARWPLVGWVCTTHGMLLVNRERRHSTATLVQQVRKKLKHGVSLLVFPEGTTGWGHDVGPFKTGVFEAVARQEHGAVLPLFLDVTSVDGRLTPTADGRNAVSHNHHSILLNHLLHLAGFRGVTMEIRVGAPIPGANSDRKELAHQSHREVCQLNDSG